MIKCRLCRTETCVPFEFILESSEFFKGDLRFRCTKCYWEGHIIIYDREQYEKVLKEDFHAKVRPTIFGSSGVIEEW